MTCTDAAQMTLFQVSFIAIDAPAGSGKRFVSRAPEPAIGATA